jgi:hypothetical protein
MNNTFESRKELFSRIMDDLYLLEDFTLYNNIKIGIAINLLQKVKLNELKEVE